MKYNVTIWFKDNDRITIINNAEKVESIPIGGGILSVIRSGKNSCFMLDTVDSYDIEDVMSE